MDFATDPVAAAFGAPTVPMLTHDQNFNGGQLPAPPKPYETWSDDISYVPRAIPRRRSLRSAAKREGTINERTVFA